MSSHTNNKCDHVFGYANVALWEATINNVENVYCDGLWACVNVTIKDVSNNVYGNGYQTLREGYVENVEGYVIGVGNEVLMKATITNSTNVS